MNSSSLHSTPRSSSQVHRPLVYLSHLRPNHYLPCCSNSISNVSFQLSLILPALPSEVQSPPPGLIYPRLAGNKRESGRLNSIISAHGSRFCFESASARGEVVDWCNRVFIMLSSRLGRSWVRSLAVLHAVHHRPKFKFQDVTLRM